MCVYVNQSGGLSTTKCKLFDIICKKHTIENERILPHFIELSVTYMLLICSALSQFTFQKLMDVYRESNRLSGKENYPDLSGDRQLLESEQDFYMFLREFFSVKGSKYYILAASDCYRSALRVEPFRDGLLIEGFETSPDSRHKGYGTELLQETLKTLQSVTVYSHIKKDNLYSLNTHLNCGFSVISDTASYIDGSVDSKSYTLMKKCGP